MSYNVLLTRTFLSQLKTLSKTDTSRVHQKLRMIGEDPHRHPLLHGAYAGHRRARVGKLRIVYRIEEINKHVLVNDLIKRHKYD